MKQNIQHIVFFISICRKAGKYFFEKYYKQKGVYLPLIAIILNAIVAIIIIFSLDITAVRAGRSELERVATIACRYAVTSSSLMQRQGATSFQNYIKKVIAAKELRYVQLTDLILTLPSMPSDGTFNEIFDTTQGTGHRIDYSSGPVQQRLSFSDPKVNLPIPELNSAFIESDVCLSTKNTNNWDQNCGANPASLRRFPDKVWNNGRAAGVSAGCWMKGKVKTIFLGRATGGKTVETSLIWSNKVRSTEPALSSNFSSTNIQPQDKRFMRKGLHILIDPVIDIDPYNRRFRFPTDLYPEATFPGFRSKYDPLQIAHGPAGTDFFGKKPPEIDFNVGLPSEPPATKMLPPQLPDKNNSLGGRAFGGYTMPPNCNTYSASSCHLPDRDQLLVQCISPPVLIRNIMLSVILELASRHGQLRDSTEVLSLNPVHQQEQQFSVSSSPGFMSRTYKNPPTIIIPFGGDLAQRKWGIPLIAWDSGVISSTPSQQGMNGVLNPFNTNTDTNTREVHALITSQLRHCFHLYSTAPWGVERFVNGIINNLFYNANFKPTSIYTYPENNPSLYGEIYQTGGGNSKPWDQGQPWAGATGYNSSKFLTAGELGGSIGVFSKCPYVMDNNKLFPGQTTIYGVQGNFCDDQAIGSKFAAYGDHLAALDYWGNLPNPQLDWGSPPVKKATQAYLFPGLFPAPMPTATATPATGNGGGGGISGSGGGSGSGGSSGGAGGMGGNYQQAPSIPLFNSGRYTAVTDLNRVDSSALLVFTFNGVLPLHIYTLRDLSSRIKAAGIAKYSTHRPVTIVWLPTTSKEISYYNAIKNGIKDAYATGTQVGDPRQGVDIEFGQYRFIGPEEYGDTFKKDENGNLLSEEEMYARFWRSLLTDPYYNAVTIARDIFFTGILWTSLNF